MDMYIIQGGTPLTGSVSISGSKNAALPIMAAALAVDGVTCLQHVPELADVRILAKLLTRLGLRLENPQQGCWTLAVQETDRCLAEDHLVRQMRASICVLGPLLARRGRACVSLPGGCQIGHRPIDVHLRGLAALGAEFKLEHGYILAHARKLRGANISLSGPAGSTVTGTCNVLTAACLAEGHSRLMGAACEPEVLDLGQFLISAGAKISGLGTSTLEVEGVERLHSTNYTIIPDRIEAATWLIAAAMTGGNLQLTDVRVDHLDAVIRCLQQIGVEIEHNSRGLHVQPGKRWQPVDVRMSPYPGLPTDIQAPLSSLLTLAQGHSRVIDTVFPDRFLHLPELSRMGADVRRLPEGSEIRGVASLSGASLVASDLRAGAALVLAALAADGESVLRRIDHIDRGYEQLERKLQSLGAQIQRVPDDQTYVSSSLAPPFETPAAAVIPSPHWSCHNRSSLIIPVPSAQEPVRQR